MQLAPGLLLLPLCQEGIAVQAGLLLALRLPPLHMHLQARKCDLHQSYVFILSMLETLKAGWGAMSSDARCARCRAAL